MQRTKRHQVFSINDELGPIVSPPTFHSNSQRYPTQSLTPSGRSILRTNPVQHSAAQTSRREGSIEGISNSIRARKRLILKVKTISMQYDDLKDDSLYVFRPSVPSPPASTRLKKFTGRRSVLSPIKYTHHRHNEGVSSFQYPTTDEEAKVFHPHFPSLPSPPTPQRLSPTSIRVLTVLPKAQLLPDF